MCAGYTAADSIMPNAIRALRVTYPTSLDTDPIQKTFPPNGRSYSSPDVGWKSDGETESEIAEE
jgi:hypothetical protein